MVQNIKILSQQKQKIHNFYKKFEIFIKKYYFYDVFHLESRHYIKSITKFER